MAAPILLQALLGAMVFFSTFSIAGTQTALALSAIAWIVLRSMKRVPVPTRTPIDLSAIAFVGACVLSSAISSDRAASFAGLKNLLLIGAFYLFGWAISDRSTARRLFMVLLLSGTASSIYGVAMHLLGKGEGSLGRSAGTFSTVMTFGGITMILASLYTAFAVGERISAKIRIANCLAAAAAILGLVFTFTRSSWLGMLASSATIIYKSRKKWLVAFAAGMVVLVLLVPSRYKARVESIWNPHYRTNVQRMELLRGGWSILREHPVFGVGTRDLASLYREHMPEGAIYVHGHMHNIFLQVAVQTGIVGLTAFCALFVCFFRLVWSNLRLPLEPGERAFVVGSLGALVGFTVNGLFEWNFGDAEVVTLLYILLGANEALRRAFAAES